MSFTYSFPRPALTVDGLLLAAGDTLPPEILLIQRKHPPFQGQWALPGGFVDQDEDPDRAIAREMEEETQARGLSWQQLAVFGTPGRDPRGHTVSVAYLALVRKEQVALRAGDDAQHLAWHPLDQLPELAFDHEHIIRLARGQLGWRLGWQLPLAHLLPDVFARQQLEGLLATLGPDLPPEYREAWIQTNLRSGRLRPVSAPAKKQKFYRFEG